MRGVVDGLGGVLRAQVGRDVALGKQYEAEGAYGRVLDLFQADLRRALLSAVNRRRKEGEGQ